MQRFAEIPLTVSVKSVFVDIFEVPWCHLFRQRSSQSWSQKLLQGLVSHELTASLFDFDLFLTQ